MKIIKNSLATALLFVAVVSFSQCSTIKKLEKQAPLNIGEVYCQKWISGVEGGGSGLNIFIPTSDTSIELDSVYFRGKATKLETKPQNKSLYIGRFVSNVNQKKDARIINLYFRSY